MNFPEDFIKQVGIEPYAVFDDGIIYNSDCINILDKMESNCIDLIITSPPYNTGMSYTNIDDRKLYYMYLELMKIYLKECYKVLISGGRIGINLPSSILQSTKSRMHYLSLDICLIMRLCNFLDREWVTWIKKKGGGIPGKSTSWGSWMSASCPYLRDASEFIIIMDKEIHKKDSNGKISDITKDEFLEFTSNCWYFPPELDREHPAPFPKELPYRLIKLYSFVNDIILDPFAGQSTTAIACIENKRKFIMIEISEEYCKISKKRINQAYDLKRQGEIFK